MQWIAVKDKKPEIGTSVLVYNITLGQHVSFFDGAGKFTHPFYDILDYGTTHWQPLPNPPNNRVGVDGASAD